MMCLSMVNHDKRFQRAIQKFDSIHLEDPKKILIDGEKISVSLFSDLNQITFVNISLGDSK